MKFIDWFLYKTTREMPAGLIAIKINEKLKKNNEFDKNGKLLSITKRQVNNILKEKYGIPLKTALMSNRSINVFLCIFTSLFFFDYLNNNSRPLFTYLLTITLFLLGIYLRLGFVFIIILTIIGIINFLKQFFQAIFQKNR